MDIRLLGKYYLINISIKCLTYFYFFSDLSRIFFFSISKIINSKLYSLYYIYLSPELAYKNIYIYKFIINLKSNFKYILSKIIPKTKLK